MGYTLLSEVTRTARKAHRCIWCWQGIKAGEQYIDERSVNDGDIQHHRWHPECLEAMRSEAEEEGGFIEWSPGQERPAAHQATKEPR